MRKGCDLDDIYRKQYKIREVQLEKTPFMLVISEKKMADGSVAVHSSKNVDMGVMVADEFVAFAKEQIHILALYN